MYVFYKTSVEFKLGALHMDVPKCHLLRSSKGGEITHTIQKTDPWELRSAEQTPEEPVGTVSVCQAAIDAKHQFYFASPIEADGPSFSFSVEFTLTLNTS